MAVYAITLMVYLGRYVHKWQGALRQPEDAEQSNPTRKDALEQSGLALSMVRKKFPPLFACIIRIILMCLSAQG